MPLLSCISYQICRSSSVFPFLFSSDIPPMNPTPDLLRLPGKKGLSAARLAVLLAEILLGAAVVWFAIPFLFGFLSSAALRIWTHLRSSTAPRYLFLAVNFIIFTVWKLSEKRSPHADCLQEEEKTSNPEPIPLLQMAFAEDRNETPSIHDENPGPAFELSRVTTDREEKPVAALIPKNPKTEEAVEEASLDATWNSIMRKSGGIDQYPPPPPAVVYKTTRRGAAGGNAPLSEGNDEINQRFDEFIKKNYDQIRLRKPGEPNQPRRIR